MRLLVSAITGVICIVFTGAVFPNFNIAGTAPDIIVCVMVSLAILDKSLFGAGLGLVCGLVLDCFFSDAIGLFAIPYLISGVAVYFVCFRLTYINRFVTPALLAAGAYIVKDLIAALLSHMLDLSFSLSYIFFRFTLPEALLTGAMMLLVHIIFSKLYQSGAMKKRSGEEFKRLK